MALIDTGSDPWLIEYEACERLSRDIMEQLSQRDGMEPGTTGYDALSGKIRIRIKQFSGEVKQLSDKLGLASILSTITQAEKDRRHNQVEVLKIKDVKMQNQVKAWSGERAPFRSNTFQPSRQAAFADLGTTSWGDLDNEPETTRSIPVSALKTEQQSLIQAQDEGLEVLSKVISRQKQIVLSINTEVDEQNVILDDIADNMDSVDERVRNETRVIKTISHKDSTWGYWLVIVLLFIAILGVALA